MCAGRGARSLINSVTLWGAAILAMGASIPHSQAASFDSNVPADIKAQMVSDLEFMGTLQGENKSSLHQQIFGAMEGTNYVQYFNSRVRSVGVNRCGGGNAVACVIPFLDPNKMWITQNYIKFSHPQIARLMVVFHEARHTESQNGNWHHATCPTPFLDSDGKEIRSIWTGSALAGEAACDTTPFGSYGSSMILLKSIQKHCTNCSEKVRMDAGIYADDQLKRVIDPAAIQQIRKDLYQDRSSGDSLKSSLK